MSGLFEDKALDTVERHEMQKRLAMALATGLFSRITSFGTEGLLRSSGRNKTIFLNDLLLPVLRFLSRLPQNFPTLLMGNLVISICVYSWTTCMFCLWSNDIFGLAQFCPPVYLQSSKRPSILGRINRLDLRIPSFKYLFCI